MSKITQTLLILFIILLAGCNRPPPTQGNTPFPTFTPTNESEQPRPPTEQPWQLPEGDPIPLFPAGKKITLHKIEMINQLSGWSIAVSDIDIEHILRTEDGGYKWHDVTPPQPLADTGTKLTVNGAFWDEGTAWVSYNGSDFVWATKDGGVTWQAAPLDYETLSGSLFSVHDGNHAWMFQFLDAGMQKVYTALYRTSNGGISWEKLLDPYTDISIQAFDKTGAVFINPQDGWLTRDFRGVQPQVELNLTQDGGFTWEALYIPEPPSAPEIFSNPSCACGLYDPVLFSTLEGSVHLSCSCYEDDQQPEWDYLYRTNDGGETWEIWEAPDGDFTYINDQIIYALSRDIYRSEDGGESWQMVRTVNWDGQFSFIDRDTAWIVAINDEEYALVKTSNGCDSFIEIKPEVIASQSIR